MDEELKRLISENKVIPFVGAGVSKSVKFKNGQDAFINWKELLETFLGYIDKPSKANVIQALLEDEPINYLEIADKIEQSLGINDFNKVLKKAFDIDYNEVDKDSYSLAKEIWNLNSKLIITTNYDKVLHKACDDENISFWDIESIHEQGNFLRDGASKPTVWNLHGHVDNINNIILTTAKYNELYTTDIKKSKYSAALSTLQTIISSNSLLFIGFSLDDEFVKNQINNTINIFSKNSCEHYILVKKGTNIDTLNGNIKIIEYENHGQPLIEKIKSLKPTSTQAVEKVEDKAIVIKQENFIEYLTTLPPKNENFIGRVEDLQAIEEMLNDKSITYIVNGIGGVGKSELSCEYFHRNMHRYNNIAFIEMGEDTLSIEELFYVKFKDRFNLNEDATLDNIIQKLQGLPSKNLLLLDNLERVKDFEKIKALNTNFDLLITTRISDIDVPNQLYLDTLNDKDAENLFLSIYDKDKDIKDILVYLDNHPLFINLTAKSLEQELITLDELRAEIKNNNIYKIDSKDSKTFKEHLDERFYKQFSNESNDELKWLLQILSIFPSIEIDFKILEKTITIDKLKVKLQRLVQRGWLNKKENSYKLHQIIKLFIETNYPLEYKDITFVFDNIAKYIDPDDSTLIASQLNEYIPLIEYFLNSHIDIEDQHICGILDSITYLYYSLGQYNKALAYQKKALYKRDILFGKTSKEIAKSYHLLAVIYKEKNELKVALEHQNKALEIQENILSTQDIDLAKSYSHISVIYSNLAELDRGLQYQNKAIAIYENNPTYSMADLAAIYNNLSTIYLKIYEKDKNSKENIDNALIYQEKSLLIAERILPEDHPSIGISYNNLSSIYKYKGNLKKSLDYQLIGSKHLEKVFSVSHPILVRQYGNLARIYIDMKECMKAKEFLLKASKILEHLDYIHPDINVIANNLKTIEADIKKQKKAKYKNKGRFCKEE